MIISGQKAEAWRCFLLQCHSSFQAKISVHDEHSLSIIIVIASNKEVCCSFRTSPHLDNACVSKHNRAAKEYKVSKKMSRVITKVRFFCVEPFVANEYRWVHKRRRSRCEVCCSKDDDAWGHSKDNLSSALLVPGDRLTRIRLVIYRAFVMIRFSDKLDININTAYVQCKP